MHPHNSFFVGPSSLLLKMTTETLFSAKTAEVTYGKARQSTWSEIRSPPNYNEQYSDHWYSMFPIIQIPIIRVLDYPNAWMSPFFRPQREQGFLVTGVLLQQKAKLLHERLFLDSMTLFLASTGVRSQFTTSELALAHDQLNIALRLYYRPCPLFRPPGRYSHKKMLTRYDIVLQSLTHSSALLSVVSTVM